MRIVIFGAGAVGTFFGGLLVRGGQEVHFVARGAQLAALNSGGIEIQSLLLGELRIAPVVAATAAPADADLVLLCVKTHQTAAALDQLSPAIADHTIVVTMQNGVDSDEEVAARFGRHRVVPAVVYVGATVEQPGVVSHVAAGTIVMGARPGVDAARLPAIRDALAASGQPVHIAEDIQRERWQKLIWNAAFNTVSALTDRPPRDLLAVAETRATLLGIMHEVVAVARARGIALDEADITRQIEWTERTAAIRTSMMVDRGHGRAMETDALIGVVVRNGHEHGIATPFSAALLGLLKALT